MDAATSSGGRCEPPATRSASKRPSEDSKSEPPRKRLPEPKITPEKNENEQTALHQAAQEGDVKRIKQLLAAGVNTCSQDVRGRTPLHVASLRRKEDAAELLVDCKHDMKDNFGRAALHIATELEYVGVMRKLIAAGANIRVQDEEGQTPLHLALLRKKLTAAELLLDADSENDVQDGSGNTPLHHAAWTGPTNIVKKLLFNGVNPHLMNEERLYPLDMALEGFHFNFYPWSFRLKCHLNVAEKCQGRERDRCDIVKVILAACAWKNINPSNWIWLGRVQEWSNSLLKCYAQVQVMKDRVLGGLTVSLYDILSQDVTKIARYLENRNTRKVLLGKRILKDFPNYADMIDFKVRAAEERRVLTGEFLGCFSFATTRRPYLPVTVTDRVLFYLSNSDIQSFVTATK